MPTNIQEDERIIIETICKKYLPQATVWVFGSRAKGSASHRSDLDLAIDNGSPLSLSFTAGLRLAFSESKLPYLVDIVDWQRTSEEFKKIIEDQRIQLF